MSNGLIALLVLVVIPVALCVFIAIAGKMTNRNDTIELILEHAIQQGSYSQNYVDRLSAMNDSELDLELERIEHIAVYGSLKGFRMELV